MKKQVEAIIPTKWGDFNMLAYSLSDKDKMPHIVLVHKYYNPEERVLVRVHSECLTGDLFGSRRCDCGEQLERALELANRHKGVVIYLRQEGRGIGIINKLKAYNLQDKGFNTVDANTHLGFEAEERTFEDAITILKDLGITKIDLLTNNPIKLEAFAQTTIDANRVPLEIIAHEDNIGYLKTKKEKMGHLLKNTMLEE